MKNHDDGQVDRARSVLGVGPTDDAQALRAAFRRRSMDTHPDRDGTADAFEEVRRAYELLLEKLVETDEGHGGDWIVDDTDEDVDIRIVDENKSPRRRRFEDLFLDALRREHGE